MAYADVKDIEAAEIPVIDVAPLFEPGHSGVSRVGAQMLEASEGIGFFYVRNHGVARAIVDTAWARAFVFFREPQSTKLTVRVSPHHRGFIPVGEAKMYGGARPDLKESFIWGLDIAEDDADFLAGALFAPNRWPASQPAMQPAFNQYFEATHAIAWRLMRAFAV